MDFNGVQTVQGPNERFSADSNRHQNKGLRTLRAMTWRKILMNEFEQETHERSSQNRARRAFVLIKRKLCYLFSKW